MILQALVDPIVDLLNWAWLAELNIPTIIIKLVLAMICGGVIGVERARKHHAAGFRTYTLVCLGATVAMITNQFIYQSTGTGDGARLGAQVISGIGFLGAGTILVTSRNQIRGLTTAAGLWACACLGLAIGVGFYTLAIIALILIISILTILPKLEAFSMSSSYFMEIHIEFGKREDLKQFLHYARDKDIHILSIEYNPAYAASGLSVYTLTINVSKPYKSKHKLLVSEFMNLEYVNFVEEIK